MARASPRQRRTTGRVMHEFKHGELKKGPRGKGGKVKSRKQAIAIALHEAGTSKYDTKTEKRRSFDKTKRKEATGQQEREGKSRVGARGKRESTRAMGGKNATKTTRARKSPSRKSSTRKASSRKRTTSRSRGNGMSGLLSRLLPK